MPRVMNQGNHVTCLEQTADSTDCLIVITRADVAIRCCHLVINHAHTRDSVPGSPGDGRDRGQCVLRILTLSATGQGDPYIDRVQIGHLA